MLGLCPQRSEEYRETGTNKVKVYGLPPAMALYVASAYSLIKAWINLADKQLEAMQDKVNLKNIEDSKWCREK